MNLSTGEITFPGIFISVLPDRGGEVLYTCVRFYWFVFITTCQAFGFVLCLNSVQNESLVYRLSDRFRFYYFKWVNTVPRWPRKPVASWLVSDRVWPAVLGQWSYPCTWTGEAAPWILGSVLSPSLAWKLVLEYAQRRATKLVRGLKSK